MKKLTAFVTLGACLAWAPLPGQAALFEDGEARKAILELRDRVSAMQTELNNLQNALGTKADKTNNLDLHAQNEQLRQEIAKLRGQIEVLTNELANTQKRQKDFYVDLDSRLVKLEPQRVTIDGREMSIDRAEQHAYDAALAFFKAGDYRNAGASFYDFTRRYPQSALAPSAHYWLGSTYYAQRDYPNAIASQQVVINNFPDSPRAPDALLNIASSYFELKDRANARKALETLVSKYPDSAAAQTARERLAALR